MAHAVAERQGTRQASRLPNTANTGQTLRKFTASPTDTLKLRAYGRTPKSGPSRPQVRTAAAAIPTARLTEIDRQSLSLIHI